MIRRGSIFFRGLIVGLALVASDAQAYTTAPKKEETTRRPGLEYQRFRQTRTVDLQIAEKRKTIRDELRELLKYEKSEERRADLVFRLAENCFEEAMFYFNQAQQLDEQLAKDPENDRLRKDIDEKKKTFRVDEDKWRLQAIELYKELIEKHPNYPNRDQVLYFLAYSLWDIGRQKDSLSVYKQLITNYPRSKYVPDSYLAFGEYYFDNATKDSALLEKALIAYKKVGEYPESPIYTYGIYKQGWCYFNFHEWEKAKEMFSQVIMLSMGEGKKLEIRKEALKDYTLTYSNEGSAEEAPTVFAKLTEDPKEVHGMVSNLAQIYFGAGQDRKAIIIYRYLISREKCSAEVPFFQGRVVDCSSRVGDKRDTVAQVRMLVELFKQTETCLTNPTPSEASRIKEARELAENTLRKLGSIWYKEAKETKQKETFQYSQEMFSDYLELFPDSPDAYDIRFAFAELLYYRLGQLERAAEEYTKIVVADLDYLKKYNKFPEKTKQGRSSPGTYLCDAAYKTVLVHREQLKAEQKKEKPKIDKEKPKELEKQPFSRERKRFLQAAEVYMDHCPASEDLCNLKYDIAKTYYDFNYFDEAIKRFDEIVRDFPNNELAEYAANLVLDSFNLIGDLDGLTTYARKYIQNQTLMKNQKLHEYLTKLFPKIVFKRMETLDKTFAKTPEGQKPLTSQQIHYKVAMSYISFTKEFKDHELADDALFNASVEFDRAERLDLARRARQKLIDEYPTSDLVPGTIFNLAENFERSTDFSKAATLYEKYAERFKKMLGLGKTVAGRKEASPADNVNEKQFEGNRRTWNNIDAQAALINAGIYREALKEFQQAITDREEFISLFPNAPDTPKVYYSLALLYENLQKDQLAIDSYKTYFDKYLGLFPDRAIAARMKRALLLQKLKKTTEAEKEFKAVIAQYHALQKRPKATTTEAAEAAAHAEFILSEDEFDEYIKYHLTATTNQKALAKEVEEKTYRLKRVEKKYTDIAKLGQAEWAIASLYKLGRAYENMAESYYKAPMPKGFTTEQQDIYMQKLRELGQPWEDKAVTHFKASVDKGSELGFYSQFTQLALAKLQEYRPAEYPREELGFEVKTVADVASRNPLLTVLWNDAVKIPEFMNEPALTLQRKETGAVGEDRK